MSQEKHMMVDIEALSTKDNGVVTNVGVVIFQPQKQKILSQHYFVLDWSDQIKDYGRDVARETLFFWFEQPHEAQRELVKTEGMIPTALFLEDFKGLCGNITKAWAKSPGFDYTMLQSLWQDYRTDKFPIQFRKLVDLRTVIWLMKKEGIPIPERNNTLHNALDDAVYQTEVLFEYLRSI